jgi:lipopolysaccharide export system protein LptA
VYSDSEGDSDQVTGTYTYSGTITSGRGTITIRGDEGSFTVNGNEAAITADGETHVFTRVNQ